MSLPIVARSPLFSRVVIDLVDELAPEDKAVVPKFDLTEVSDSEVGAAEAAAAVLVPALAGSLPSAEALEDAEEVTFWLALPALAPDTSDLPNPFSQQRPVATPQCSLGTDGRRPTRWGRCVCCGRDLRPGLSCAGSPVLLCSKFKRGEGHSYRTLLPREAKALAFPPVMLARIRVLW